ncbi:hypothetical protein ACIRPX_45300 [Streptomyces sp. NPDC101225]|uniref:hypothetical protein n=1 Tax=Streptomyces sp. NPDC101225 TaxID=3366135 RepID=UPI003801344B
MTPSSWVRAHRVIATASVLAVVAIAIVLLVLAAKSGGLKGWWPHTGRAFATDTDPCDLITGPGKRYCERSTSTNALRSDREPDTASAAFELVPAGAGVAALMVWQRRGVIRQEQR